jgi:hypothetical protein
MRMGPFSGGVYRGAVAGAVEHPGLSGVRHRGGGLVRVGPGRLSLRKGYVLYWALSSGVCCAERTLPSDLPVVVLDSPSAAVAG